MTARSYLTRALFVQCAVSFLSCGQLHADVPAIPAGLLTPEQIAYANAVGLQIGLLVTIMVLLLGVSILSLKMLNQIWEVKEDLRQMTTELVRVAGGHTP